MKTHVKRRPAPLSLRARTACDLMNANPLSIGRWATVEEVATFLSSKGISAAPVIDEAGRPIGVISRTDLLNCRVLGSLRPLDAPNEGPPYTAGARPAAVQPGRVRVVEVMTPAVFCVRPETAAGKVVEKMLALGVRRLFVVDSDGVLVGVVSAFDVLKNLRPERVCEGQPV